MIKKNKNSAFLFIILLLIGIIFYQYQHAQKHTNTVKTSKTSTTQKVNNSTTSTEKIPQKVLDVLAYITAHHKPMNGYVGGRIFNNREKRLPIYTSSKLLIRYQEWDVNPKVKGQNRGAERLITSNEGSAYYTSNHYQTFIKIP